MRATRILLLVLAAASSALAQDAPTNETAVERAPPPEPSRAWAEWSRGFASELVAAGRPLEAAEEMYAAALYDRREVDLLCDAAVILVEYGSRSSRGIATGTPYEIFAGQAIALAIERGAGPEQLPELVDGENPEGDPPESDEPPRAGDPRLAYALGRLAWARRDFAMAALMHRDAFDGGFDRTKALDWYFRGAVNAAPTRFTQGGLDEGIADLERVLELDPQHAERVGALINLADGYRRREETVPALAIMEKLVAEHPNSGAAWYTYGLVLKSQGKPEESADALQRAVEALARDGQDFTQPLLDRVEVLQKLARVEEAESEVRRYLVLRPDDPKGVYRLSRIRRDRKDIDDAIFLARRATRLDKQSLLFLENLRTLLHRRGRPEDAEELVEATARYDVRLAELKLERYGPPEDTEAPEDTEEPDGAGTDGPDAPDPQD